MIHFAKADYLVTGDKDLLEHTPFKVAKIITPAVFEKELEDVKSAWPPLTIKSCGAFSSRSP